MKLLVIEDSIEVLQRMRQLLAAIPGVVLVADATLAGGIERLRREPPDLVVLDIHLPDGDGRQLLEIARREFPATRVFVLTNHVFHRRQCLLAGAERFFDKSMEFTNLLEAVKELNR